MVRENEEEWRPVPGFPAYEASSEGRIRNRRGRILTGTPTKKGHRQVNVRGAHGRVTVEVHRLVAAAFLRPPSAGEIVAHLNGNRLDNRPSNLKVTTPSGNVRHAAALGLAWPTRMRGEANPNAKLIEEEVVAMRALRQQGVPLAELGRRFGVTERAAHRVVTRKDWKHVA
jgi:hypothetical protein